jgi:uncharacterized coiled-coil DUF342 family protein
MTDRELLELLVEKVSQLEPLIEKVSNIEVQLDETNQIVKALRHNHEEVNAQIHSLGHSVNKLAGQVAKLPAKEDFDRLGLDVAFLMRKTGEHDSDIRKIRMAE